MSNMKHHRRQKNSLFTGIDLLKPDDDEDKNKKRDKKLTPSQERSRNHIMNHYSKILFHHALFKTKDRQTACTVANDVLLSFNRSFPEKFPEDVDIANIKKWMFTVLRYKIYDSYREKGQDKRINYVDMHTDPTFTKIEDPESLEEPESLYKWAKECEILDWAVTTFLKPNRQKIFYMAACGKIRHDKIAKELGMTTSSVKTIASRDKRMIKEKIKEKLENTQ